MAEAGIIDRMAMARRGRRLEYFTILWNTLEGIVAIVAGVIAGSISLVGFGIDSFIEVTSGAALLWRMAVDADVEKRERNEKLALRIVGFCFVALAVYVSYESVNDLLRNHAAQHSIPGIVLACVSLFAMPLLSRAKRRVGHALGSAAMHADAKQTEFCVYLICDPASRVDTQRALRSVVGRPANRARHGSNHCQGRNRGDSGQSVSRLLRLSGHFHFSFRQPISRFFVKHHDVKRIAKTSHV